MELLSTPKFELRQVYLEKYTLIDGRLQPVVILADISFTVAAGESLCLLGPSGSGKSSLLRLLNRLDDPSRGEILLDGQSLLTLPVQQLRRRVGLVFQTPALLAGSVAANISYGPSLLRKPCDPGLYLEKVGLPRELLSRPAQDLSVGQKQRVAIARALANQPEVLLLDEPTAALDPEAAANILDLIRELRADLGLTVIMVTHLAPHAEAVADRVIYLEKGRVVRDEQAITFFRQEG